MASKLMCMVIDLNACVGCAACDIACKSENNVPDGFAWSNHIIEMEGVFPKVKYRYTPTLCNHCTNAPCVAVCPTTAMHKDANGITMHDAEKCIGCGACVIACPYSVIYFNKNAPHVAEDDDQAIIPECTSSPDEMREALGVPLPYYNPVVGVRPQGIVEKCTFCEHRLSEGLDPACVEACPAGARIFGDRNDPNSAASQALDKHRARVLQPEQGTQPNVLYIREY